MKRLVSLLSICLAAISLLEAAPAETAAPNKEVLSTTLQTAISSSVLSGAVLLVANQSGVLDLEAAGVSDLATKRPMQTDDLFWIASMSKTVTAAAFMILVDEGKVSVDDPVEKYIPAFHDLKVKQPDGTLVPPSHPVLIREILSHTSGMGFLNRTDHMVIDSVPLETSVQHALQEPLNFDPGTKYSYSNEGIDAAGRIIEIVSGMPYEQFLQEKLFTPLGMVDTTFHPSPDQLRRLAKTYKSASDKKTLVEAPIHYLTYPLDGPNRYPAPGGGLFSTARDVYRFCLMLLNGGTLDGMTYLSKDAVFAMTTKQTGPLVPNFYGFGCMASTHGQTFGHGGAFKTSMSVDQGIIRVFLVQQDGDWAAGNPNGEVDAEVRKQFYPAAAAPAPPAAQVGTQVPVQPPGH